MRRFAATAGAVITGLALGCSPDGGIGPGGPAAEVVVTGAPAGVFFVGDSVQLVATPLNRWGAILTNQPISWASSDEDVVAVSSAGRVTAIGGGAAQVTATSGDGIGTVNFLVSEGGEVGPAGATLVLWSGRVHLTIPSGVYATPTPVLATTVPSPPLHTQLVAGSAIRIEPNTLYLGNATLSMAYDPAVLPAGVPERNLELYRSTSAGWAAVPGSAVLVDEDRVQAPVFSAGTYALIGTPVDHLVISGGLKDGALVASQSGSLTATAFSEKNAALPGRPITWESSHPDRATVDGNGLVTAVSAGAVVIRASAEGKSDSTTVTVIARPVADWSQATEWSTFQGNARHTGLVPVTVDPVVFAFRWQKAPIGAGPLNPVTASAGQVFASTVSYFGTQRLVALNSTTGATMWSKDYGGIHGVHPPATGGGKVYVTTSGHGDSFLWQYDALTGAPGFKSAYTNQWSRFYAPVVLGDAIYMSGGYYGGMYAFSGAGEERWFVGTNQYDEWTPAVHDGLAYTYTGSYSAKVTAHDLTTGALAFEIPDPAFDWGGWSMHQAPVLGGANDLLATNGGRLLSFNLGTRTIGWTQTGSFSGTPAVADGVIYVLNVGRIEMRSQATGAYIDSWTPPEGTPRQPFILTNNLLFVSTATHTYAVDRATRRHLWRYPASGTLALAAEGILYISQANGALAAISVR